jgi:hypothetical protein
MKRIDSAHPLEVILNKHRNLNTSIDVCFFILKFTLKAAKLGVNFKIKKPATFVAGFLSQRGRDSNPRYREVYTLSKRAP